MQVARTSDQERIDPLTGAVPQASSVQSASQRPDEEQRYRMIAEGAYYLAQRRAFAAGSELDDWLLAEAEIDAMLANHARQ